MKKVLDAMCMLAKRIYKKDSIDGTKSRLQKINSLPVIFKTENQIIDFFTNTPVENIDGEEIAYFLLKNLNQKELLNVILYLENEFPDTYNELKNGLNCLIVKNQYVSELAIGFQSKEETEFLDSLNEGSTYTNPEYILPLLLNLHNKYSNPSHDFFIPLYNTILLELNIEIQKKIAFINSKISAKNNLNFELMLNNFFFTEKEVGITSFKKFIHLEKNSSHTIINQLRHWRIVEIFFSKLNLNYIPIISYNKKSIVLSDLNNSITKKEVIELINTEDYFKDTIPLCNFDNKALLNPIINFRDKSEIILLISRFVENDLRLKILEKFDDKELNIVEVFVDNISNPLPLYSKNQLIFVREKLKNSLVNRNKKKHFLALFFNLVKEGVLLGVSGKIDKIISEYFGDGIFTVSVVKRNVIVKSEEDLDISQIELVQENFNHYF